MPAAALGVFHGSHLSSTDSEARRAPLSTPSAPVHWEGGAREAGAGRGQAGRQVV